MKEKEDKSGLRAAHRVLSYRTLMRSLEEQKRIYDGNKHIEKLTESVGSIIWRTLYFEALQYAREDTQLKIKNPIKRLLKGMIDADGDEWGHIFRQSHEQKRAGKKGTFIDSITQGVEIEPSKILTLVRDTVVKDVKHFRKKEAVRKEERMLVMPSGEISWEIDINSASSGEGISFMAQEDKSGDTVITGMNAKGGEDRIETLFSSVEERLLDTVMLEPKRPYPDEEEKEPLGQDVMIPTGKMPWKPIDQAIDQALYAPVASSRLQLEAALEMTAIQRRGALGKIESFEDGLEALAKEIERRFKYWTGEKLPSTAVRRVTQMQLYGFPHEGKC